jgi:hypothetical protein
LSSLMFSPGPLICLYSACLSGFDFSHALKAW